mmetsp:Transcript_4690/g.9201  ORF Transcript_4690/g.9201 Transcript_4690/m.9201 type:complete len:116 (+) Transcript_4690:630-977(+)
MSPFQSHPALSENDKSFGDKVCLLDGRLESGSNIYVARVSSTYNFAPLSSKGDFFQFVIPTNYINITSMREKIMYKFHLKATSSYQCERQRRDSTNNRLCKTGKTFPRNSMQIFV